MSSTTLIFIPRILLRRLKNEQGAERKCQFDKIMWMKKDYFLKCLMNII
jgi:hypothetical protein